MQASQTMTTLLSHAWLKFRRAHYFGKGVGVKALLVFLALILLWYLYMLGLVLPNILGAIFPEKSMLDAFFSLLLYVYAADLLTRFFAQKIPRQSIRAYLPLPVSRRLLSRFIVFRSWLSPLNVYLLAVLIPLFRALPETAAGSKPFWFALTGCILLIALNHVIIFWIKTWPNKWHKAALAAILISFHLGVGGIIDRELYMHISLKIGHAFMAGHPLPFILTVFMIISFQFMALRGLRQSFYSWAGDAGQVELTRNNPLEKFFNHIPVYGHLWELEWKLITRNKRARNNFYQYPLMIPLLVFLLYNMTEETATGMAPVLMMFMGSYGMYHLQFAFSWESRFFDLLASKQLSMATMITSRYYFYGLLAMVQFMIMLPFIIWINPGLLPLLLALLLYITGPVFALLFYTGIGNSTRIDPNGQSFFNAEGLSGRLFITVLLIFMSILPMFALAVIMPLPYLQSFSLLAGFTGFVFMLFHRRWIRAAARRFEKAKHIYLNKYREK